MTSISRSMVLAASLLAAPFGAVAQHASSDGGDATKSTMQGNSGKSTGPSSATNSKTVVSENRGDTTKNAMQGESGKSTGPSAASSGDNSGRAGQR